VRLLAHQKNTADQIGTRHVEISNSLSAIQQHLIDFKGQSHETAVKSEQHLRNVDRTLTAIAAEGEAVRDVANSLKAFNSVAENIKSVGGQMSAGVKAINDNIAALNTSLKGTSGSVSSDIKAILNSIESQEVVSKSLAGSISDLRVGLDNFAKVEKDIASSVEKQLKAAAPVAPVENEEEVANLVWQLNSLLDEIAQGNTNQITELLKKQQ
jgi:methyl-accepting chemotaxis protein